MMTLIGYYLLSRLNEHVQKLTTALPYAMIGTTLHVHTSMKGDGQRSQLKMVGDFE